jgi:hypothetical protein
MIQHSGLQLITIDIHLAEKTICKHTQVAQRRYFINRMLQHTGRSMTQLNTISL